MMTDLPSILNFWNVCSIILLMSLSLLAARVFEKNKTLKIAVETKACELDEQRTELKGLYEKLGFMAAQEAQSAAQKALIEKSECRRELKESELQKSLEEIAVLKVKLLNMEVVSRAKEQLIEKMQVELYESFKLAADKALDQANKKYSLQNNESLSRLMGPLESKLQQFDQRIMESRTIEAQSQQKILSELENVTQVGLNLGDQALSLTNALKSEVKTQGSWGEMILESLLEKSGLRKDSEYFVQQTLYNAEGLRVRPDVFIRLPDSRLVVIDAKVSIAAFIRSVDAKNDEERAAALDEHVGSLKSHIKGLAGKQYQTIEGAEALDCVLMFVPNEVGLTSALNHDVSLFELAMDRRIVLVSPNTLHLALSQVQGLWRIHNQNKHAEQIAKEAGLLVDKFAGFIEDMDKVGQRLDQARNSYDGALNKLSLGNGNIRGKVQKLVELGARSSKRIPGIDWSAEPIIASHQDAD